MSSYCDIAIAGGGMMGASLALLLAKVLPDKKVQLIDKTAFESRSHHDLSLPSFDARSTALAPTTVELMKYLGVWEDMLSHATAIRTVQVSNKGHIGWTRLHERDNDGQALGYVVENRAIGQALVSAILNNSAVELSSGIELEQLKPVKDAVVLSLSDGSESRCELALIADGANSSLGRTLGLAQTQRDYRQSALVANVQFEQAHHGIAFERFTQQGPMALLPLAGDSGRMGALVWTWPQGEVATAMAMDDAEFMRVLQAEFGYRLGNFTKVSKRFSYPLQLCLANEQVRSNLVMMGNAAHFLHPVAGQGFNLAARDALCLAQTLQEAEGSLGDLGTLMKYQERQSKDQLRTIALSHGFNALFGSENLIVAGIRNLGMLAIENCDSVRNVFIRQLSGRATPKVSL